MALADEVGPDGLAAFWYERELGVRPASSLTVLLNRWNETYREAEAGEEGRGTDRTEKASPLGDAPVFVQAAPMAEASPDEDSASSADPRVRSDFQNTALWIGQLTTDDAGKASFELQLPDNTTTWRALARAATAETQVGEGESELARHAAAARGAPRCRASCASATRSASARSCATARTRRAR